MKKILFVQGVWANGGIEKVVDTYCQYLIKKGYKIDIFAFEKKESVFTKRLENLGINIISPDNIISGGYIRRNIERLKAFLNVISNNYDIIHYNTSFAMSYIHCWFAKKINKKSKIVLHSHGDGVNAPHIWIKTNFNNLVKYIFQGTIDYCIGCSDEAGKWLYTKKRFNGDQYSTIMNAIDLNKYMFNEESRKFYRNKWGWCEGEFVIGTIGRLDYQKNPYFIIEVIYLLKEISYPFKFIWIGNGDEKENIMRIVNEKHLQENIVFVESTDDVPGCLSGFDMMILPSRYEGLGLVLLEAQASGLVTLASDTIPRVAKITDKLYFYDISDAKVWRDAIIHKSKEQLTREYPKTEIDNSMFNHEKIMLQLVNIYECEVWRE